jgi:hypothetical protein
MLADLTHRLIQTMLETAGLLGWLSAALLFAAFAAWLKLGRGPRLQTLNRRAARNSEEVENASRLLLITLGVSSIAAILAVAGWMLR